eukprot:SAG11_NODE_80_length_17731_cov_13.985254_6_plen_94_part_00
MRCAARLGLIDDSDVITTRGVDRDVTMTQQDSAHAPAWALAATFRTDLEVLRRGREIKNKADLQAVRIHSCRIQGEQQPPRAMLQGSFPQRRH